MKTNINKDSIPYTQKCGPDVDPLVAYKERMRAMFGPLVEAKITPVYMPPVDKATR